MQIRIRKAFPFRSLKKQIFMNCGKMKIRRKLRKIAQKSDLILNENNENDFW